MLFGEGETDWPKMILVVPDSAIFAYRILDHEIMLYVGTPVDQRTLRLDRDFREIDLSNIRTDFLGPKHIG